MLFRINCIDQLEVTTRTHKPSTRTNRLDRMSDNFVKQLQELVAARSKDPKATVSTSSCDLDEIISKPCRISYFKSDKELTVECSQEPKNVIVNGKVVRGSLPEGLPKVDLEDKDRYSALASPKQNLLERPGIHAFFDGTSVQV